MARELALFKFSSDDITVDNKTVESEIQKRITTSQLQLGRKPSVEEEEIIKEQIISKRNVEKEAMKGLVQTYANNNKKITTFNLCADLMFQIEESIDNIKLTIEESKWLPEAFTKLQGNIPSLWFKCRELFAQIENPEMIKIDAEDTKKE